MQSPALKTPAEILSKLVRFASVVGQPNGDIIDFVRTYLAEHGVQSQILPGPEGDRSNLFASIGPKDRPGYVLSGHLDVVPARDQPGWRATPFELRQDGARLIGRGAVDMKGFVAAVLSSVPALVAMDLAVPIHIALSYDEEAGCRGVPHLITALPQLCAAPLGCVIGEPTGMVPVLRHKGKATLKLTARGVGGHSARPDQGKNAIHMLMPALNAALDLSTQMQQGTRHDAFDPPFSTLQVGTISGGTAVNMIPENATSLVELRALPGSDPVALLEPVMKAARNGDVECDVIAQYPGLDLAEASALAHLLSDLTSNAPCQAVSFGTEAGCFAQAGYPAIVCGPGDMSRAHRAEEFITTSELDDACQCIMRLAQRGA